ncbi:hypothetical protein Tco_0289055, partial [Tanacetum coccineum]
WRWGVVAAAAAAVGGGAEVRDEEMLVVMLLLMVWRRGVRVARWRCCGDNGSLGGHGVMMLMV